MILIRSLSVSREDNSVPSALRAPLMVMIDLSVAKISRAESSCCPAIICTSIGATTSNKKVAPKTRP